MQIGLSVAVVSAITAWGMTPAMAAAPEGPSQLVALTDSVTPYVTAKVSAPSGSGKVTARFYAGTYAANGANDLADGKEVTVDSGEVARLKLPDMRIGTQFQWQVKACVDDACSDLSPLQLTRVSPMAGAGERPGATRLKFATGDSTAAQVDVGSGNLLLNASGLSLPGISGDVGLGAAYNSAALGTDATSATAPLGYGWRLTPYDIALKIRGEGSVTYYGQGGVTGLFVKSGSGFTTPGGFKADLKKNDDGTYTLTDHGSQSKQTFNSSGRLTKITDRNGNATTLAYNGDLPSTIVSTRGTQAQKTAVYASAGGRVTTLSQTGSDGKKRTVTYTVDGAGDLASVKDTLGRTTSFTYSGHQLVSVTNPGGGVTRFEFGAIGATKITQENKAAGSPGDSVTRLSYADPAKTVVASPDTDQSKAVTAVPHITYELTDNHSARVAKATDAEGRERSKTYTANFDTASSTDGSGASAGTTSNSFGANDGESLTKSESADGSTFAAAYGNTSASSKYSPSESTDGQSNKSTYSYNGAGNMASSSNAEAAEAKVDYNDDGTVKTSTDPGNSTDTSYSYNSDKQLTGVNPAGGSLKAQSYTYDTFGRLATAKDGRGITTTTTYDDADRVLKVDYSDATPDVSYTYDAFGRTKTRTDASGTTTYGYDDLGAMTSRTATSGGGTLSYTYDKNGNRLTTTDARGTTQYKYDQADKLTQVITDAPSTKTKIGFTYDDRGRRTDTYYGTNDAKSIFKARVHQDYDKSGRISRVWADQGPATDTTRQFDATYCRSAGSTTSCSTAKADNRTLIQWSKDNLSGKTTKYTYDKANRLTKVATDGGGKTYTYGYDARGNRKTSSDGTTDQALAYDAANQITTSGYTYDAKGGLTKTPKLSALTYDAAGRMATAKTDTGTGTYTYAGEDATELTHQTTDKGESVDYVYGAPDQYGMPVIEQVGLKEGTAFIDHDPTTGQPLSLRTTNGYEAYYIVDGIGNPVQFINQSTVQSAVFDYDPYGAVQIDKPTGTAAVQNPYRFVGGTYDRTTGYVKYGQRWYDPSTGRFTTQDQLSFLANPVRGNRYAYAGDDPINNIDPSGRASGLSGFVDKVSKVKDYVDIGKDAYNGDWKGVGSTVAGMVGGAMTGSTCGAIAVGFGVATGGAGLVTGAACLVASEVGSYAASDFVDRQF
ncbi:RHS repeat-associated core domain-containing protein [Streptomyces sp. NPDC007088]|uniref:RHS repeat-associated core domain-containing protein n=1 Tax=Streptomyces sp. NPDC007088 TaxID=3364773 RepID=UPI0036C9C71A